LKVYCFPSNVGGCKKTRLVVMFWQLECQARNVTASVQSDNLLHRHHGLVVGIRDTHASVSCPRCGNLPDLNQDYWLATCYDWWTGMSHARLCREDDMLRHCLAGFPEVKRLQATADRWAGQTWCQILSGFHTPKIIKIG